MKSDFLLVSYFFAPHDGIAAKRWDRFSRELVTQNISLKVFTQAWGHQNFPAQIDITCISDGHAQDSKQVQGGPSLESQKYSLKGTLLKLLPAFLLIDGKFFWSLKIFLKILSLPERDVPILVTGSPWSTVFLVSLACRMRNIPCIVEFRDFWAAEPFRTHFNGFVPRKYFSFLESLVLRWAHKIITVNENMRDYFRDHGFKKEILVIPHGLLSVPKINAAEFNSCANSSHEVLYSGSVSDYHGFDEFVYALTQIGHEEILNHFSFQGKDHTHLLDQLPIEKLPAADESKAFEEMKKAAVLFLTLGAQAQHYTTGKLMTYIEAGRPIFYFGPSNSPAAQLISRWNLGWVVDSQDVIALRQALSEIVVFLKTKSTAHPFRPNLEGLNSLTVRSLMESIIKALRRDPTMVGMNKKWVPNSENSQISRSEPPPPLH